MLTRYQDDMNAALVGHQVPAAVNQIILGSLGGALTVASTVGGATGLLLSQAARSAFMSGVAVSLAVGAVVAFGGAVIVVAALPSGRRVDRPILEASSATLVDPEDSRQ
jgi:DHA2 family multidrug resistance protein-like MFS transporter